jgi:hypothetical protein
LKETVAAPVLKTEITVVGIHRADHSTPPLSTKAGSNFSDKRRWLGRYISLTDLSHGVIITVIIIIIIIIIIKEYLGHTLPYRLRHYATSRKVAGSRFNEVI